MGNVIGAIGVLAWSENGWRGFDRKGYENRKSYKYGFVENTGIAYEWWNFYEGFDEKYYFGHIETKGKKPTRLNAGIVIFVSRNVNDGKQYFVGFYGKGEYNEHGFKTNKNVVDLLPEDVKEDIKRRLERGEIEQEHAEYLKKVLARNVEFVTSFRGEKSFSTVFDKEGYIKVIPEDLGVKRFGQWTFSYIGDSEKVKPEKIRQLLLMAKQKHEELLQRPDISEARKKEIREIIEKINLALDEYFGGRYLNNITLNLVLSKLKKRYEREWKTVEKDFMERVEQIRKIIYSKIDQNQPFSEEDVEEILRISKSVPKNARFLLSFIASAGRPEKEILLSLVNNGHFGDFVTSLKDSDFDAIKANYDAIKNEVLNVKHTALTTWLAILRPDLFMPIWGYVKDPGTLPQTLLKDFKELKKFVQWWNLSTNDLFELLDVLRNAANDAGITNMFETAFYLNKYEDRTNVDSPENGEDDVYLIEMKNKIRTILNSKKQLILYGPPGTGKTWLAREYIKSKTRDDREYYEFVTFHPSYSYEEFIEGLKPVPTGNGVKFVVEDGIFKKMAIKAICSALMEKGESSEIISDIFDSMTKIEKGENRYKEYSEAKRKLWEHIRSLNKDEIKEIFGEAPEFYLIIDEINRGDISKIFGELITLLEADKRLGEGNQILVTLPYSKESFAIPPNLYIIGTMNTADRSIALIDVALRRRFGFIEVMPSYRVLLKELLDKEVESEDKAVEEIKNWEPNNLDENDPEDIKKLAIRVLYSINERIKKLYDRDHQIGHSYLLKLKEVKDRDSTIRMLRFIWYHEILPLLQEYFYDSPEKLKDVVRGFVDVNDNYFEFEEYEEDSEFLQKLKNVAEGK